MAFQAVPSRYGYTVRQTGAARPLKTRMSRPDAWAEAARLARMEAATAYLFGADGRIAKRVNYAHG